MAAIKKGELTPVYPCVTPHYDSHFWSDVILREQDVQKVHVLYHFTGVCHYVCICETGNKISGIKEEEVEHLMSC